MPCRPKSNMQHYLKNIEISNSLDSHWSVVVVLCSIGLPAIFIFHLEYGKIEIKPILE